MEPTNLAEMGETHESSHLLDCLPHTRVPEYWSVLKNSLQLFVEQLTYGHSMSSAELSDCIKKCIHTYRTDYETFQCYNFKNLKSALDEYSEISTATKPLTDILISIAQGALKLEKIELAKLHLLSSGRNQLVKLSLEEVHAILCNGFFCSFLQRDPHDDFKFSTYPRINFIRLFSEEGAEDMSRNAVKVQKLMCLLAYFEVSSTRKPDGSPTKRKLIYERRCDTTNIAWHELTDVHFHDIRFSVGTFIENDADSLQVDFANKSLGGGSLGNGSVQEEIRFITCPELIAAQLFTEHLSDNEVMFLDGAALFSTHSGYARTFQFEGLVKCEPVTGSLVAMDAMMFGRHGSKRLQYEQTSVDRELHKCNVAFGKPEDLRHIASGKWGCGAFGGDPELKILLQWMVSSYYKRSITFHLPDPKNDTQLAETMERLVKIIHRNNITVDQIYNAILCYNDVFSHEPASFKEFLKTNLLASTYEEVRNLFGHLPFTSLA